MVGNGSSTGGPKKGHRQNAPSTGIKTGDIASFFGGKPLATKKRLASPAPRPIVKSGNAENETGPGSDGSKQQQPVSPEQKADPVRRTARMRARDSEPRNAHHGEKKLRDHGFGASSNPGTGVSVADAVGRQENFVGDEATLDVDSKGGAASATAATASAATSTGCLLMEVDKNARKASRKRRIVVADDDDEDDASHDNGTVGTGDRTADGRMDHETEKRSKVSKKRKSEETCVPARGTMETRNANVGITKDTREPSNCVQDSDGDHGKDKDEEKVDLETKDSSNQAPDDDASHEEEEDEVLCEGTSGGDELGSKLESRAQAKLALSYDFGEVPKWQPGKPVPYRFLADAFNKVEQIHGRLEIQAILTDVFRKIIDTTPEDLLPAIYLCMNKLSAAHEGIESGVGEFILLKALSQTSGSTVAVLKAKYRETGDLGDVAAGARATQTTMFPPPPLKIRSVFAEMKSIAMSAGKTSTGAKKAKILKLLVASQSKNETRYLARAMQGKLRIHLAVKTVVTSLANAFTLRQSGVDTGFLLDVEGNKKAKLTEKEKKVEDELKEAANTLSAIYNQLPVWEKLVPALLKHREIGAGLANDCKFTPGIPVSPMLAKPTKAITEVLTRFEKVKFTCEYKYDGERAQVHRLEDGTVKVYSRNAEDLTEKYPDIVNSIPSALKAEFKGASFVLDAETVAYDVEKKKILPFQDLQGRKRKDVAAGDVTVTVCLFAFDLLFFNGESLLLKPLSQRREIMYASFEVVEGVFLFAKGHDSRDTEEIMELLNESIKAGCEGLMVKALEGENATYEPANRSQNWLKVKKDYLDGVGDTLDLVPIGGYLGKGKRLGTYGGFLLACYDQENEVYQSICKIGTGFSDADLESFAKYFNDETEDRRLDAPKSYFQVSDNKILEPDIWFEPCQVWEVLCADLSVSPNHKAALGLVDGSKGIALRFPRFVRIRDDKGPEDATDASQVAELYAAQSAVTNKV